MMERAAQKIIAERRLLKVHIEELGLTVYMAYGAKFDKAYIFLPSSFCSCFSFYFNVFSRRVSSNCVHLEACALSQSSIPVLQVNFETFKNKVYPLIFKGLLF